MPALKDLAEDGTLLLIFESAPGDSWMLVDLSGVPNFGPYSYHPISLLRKQHDWSTIGAVPCRVVYSVYSVAWVAVIFVNFNCQNMWVLTANQQQNMTWSGNWQVPTQSFGLQTSLQRITGKKRKHGKLQLDLSSGKLDLPSGKQT